jgi:hypothetical protein
LNRIKPESNTNTLFLIIFDNLRSHHEKFTLNLFNYKNIIIKFFPGYFSKFLSPLDNKLFAHIKEIYFDTDWNKLNPKECDINLNLYSKLDQKKVLKIDFSFKIFERKLLNQFFQKCGLGKKNFFKFKIPQIEEKLLKNMVIDEDNNLKFQLHDFNNFIMLKEKLKIKITKNLMNMKINKNLVDILLKTGDKKEEGKKLEGKKLEKEEKKEKKIKIKEEKEKEEDLEDTLIINNEKNEILFCGDIYDFGEINCSKNIVFDNSDLLTNFNMCDLATDYNLKKSIFKFKFFNQLIRFKKYLKKNIKNNQFIIILEKGHFFSIFFYFIDNRKFCFLIDYKKIIKEINFIQNLNIIPLPYQLNNFECGYFIIMSLFKIEELKKFILKDYILKLQNINIEDFMKSKSIALNYIGMSCGGGIEDVNDFRIYLQEILKNNEKIILEENFNEELEIKKIIQITGNTISINDKKENILKIAKKLTEDLIKKKNDEKINFEKNLKNEIKKEKEIPKFKNEYLENENCIKPIMNKKFPSLVIIDAKKKERIEKRKVDNVEKKENKQKIKKNENKNKKSKKNENNKNEIPKKFLFEFSIK